MRVIGKLLVVSSGLIVGILLTWETLRIIAGVSSLLTYPMAVLFVLYIIGWLLSLFLTKQRLLAICILLYIAYFVYLMGPIGLFLRPSQFTYIIAFMLLLGIGMRLSRKRQPRGEKQ